MKTKLFFKKLVSIVMFCGFMGLCFLSSNVAAHQLSTAYLELNTSPNNPNLLTGVWQMEIADLEYNIDFDQNNDGDITWREVLAQKVNLDAYVMTSVLVKQEGNQCAVSLTGNLNITERFNQPYLVMPVDLNCFANGAIFIEYQALFADNPNHKAIASINGQPYVFSATQSGFEFDLKSTSYLATFVEFTYQGVLHIWKGLDHILFLVALLLTCVLTRKAGQWQENSSNKQIFIQTAWIVTAFTIAHSITLTATALDFLSPNIQWVEIGIAISVLLAALNNIWPLVLRLGWITFAFGLLHGMGFASVLGDLGLSQDYTVLSVLAFNLGVELGQLAILAVAIPVLIAIKRFTWYRKWAMPSGSMGIALIALLWSIERV